MAHHRQQVELSESADDILNVTSVTSSTSRAPTFPRRSRQSEDAFSSSSSEEEELDDGRGYGSVSEFDKALRTGSTNKGDFFIEAQSAMARVPVNTEVDRLDQQQQHRKPRQRSPRRRNQKQQRIPQKTRSPPRSPTIGLPPPPPSNPPTIKSTISVNSDTTASTTQARRSQPASSVEEEDVSSGVLPDVLMTMRQKIESLTLFDSDMMKLAESAGETIDDRMSQETRESLKRSSQQSLSAAVLVSLAHKRYERRRLAAMEIEKVVRSLVVNSTNKGESLERVRAILLLLSDDYVRSTSEDARKGGIVAMAACGIALKRASESPEVSECRDLILASVVHACQDHSQRVRYYATESLFNVVKVMPALAVQHFFILFEILRSLYADVDVDVRSGAELLDKKLKEVIVGAINSGSFTADACVPIFARFVYMRNKATKRLTLTWLQELNEKLLGAPVLDFLHLFLGGIFAMIADPNISIRQSALAFLQSVLPKLVMEQDLFEEEEAQIKVDFDKLIQSLVTTLEHPDPFVRKVAMYWMSRIVKAHMTLGPANSKSTPATMSVRNSLPHLLPGILLSIGDTFHQKGTSKDSFLPDQTTRSLAQQTNQCLQDAVRRDGKAYVSQLDGFIVALREELDSPGGIIDTRTPPAIERKPYRMDVNADGTGIESAGWFRDSNTQREETDSAMLSRLCALQWVIVLYESVVPDVLKADYAREFVSPIIHQLVDSPPENIIYKSLEVLGTITVPVGGERLVLTALGSSSLAGLLTPSSEEMKADYPADHPMSSHNITFALDILESSRGQNKSRNREVFAVLIRLHSQNPQLLSNLSRVIQYMCTLQPPEFVFVSFSVELDKFVTKRLEGPDIETSKLSDDLQFVSSFVQQMNHVLLNTEETAGLRSLLMDCIGSRMDGDRDKKRAALFHILLHSFAHNVVASVSLCLLGGAYRTSSSFLYQVDPLDIDLVFLMEVDKLVEVMERPVFRNLHLRMVEPDENPYREGSGAMLFRALKSLLMILPQSTAHNILSDRLVPVARFRQTALSMGHWKETLPVVESMVYVNRVLSVRRLHCSARWETIRSDSLEMADRDDTDTIQHEFGSQRREWLGYKSAEEERLAREKHLAQKRQRKSSSGFLLDTKRSYDEFGFILSPTPESVDSSRSSNPGKKESVVFPEEGTEQKEWKQFWSESEATSEKDAIS